MAHSLLVAVAYLQVHPGCSRFMTLRLNRKGTLLLASSLDKHARMFEVGARPPAAEEGLTAQDALQKLQSLLKARPAAPTSHSYRPAVFRSRLALTSQMARCTPLMGQAYALPSCHPAQRHLFDLPGF